jgi:predicted phosphoribosyltransferase
VFRDLLLQRSAMSASRSFTDRRAAGKALAKRPIQPGLDDPVVLAMPRGWCSGGRRDRALSSPLDLVFVRKFLPIGRQLCWQEMAVWLE